MSIKSLPPELQTLILNLSGHPRAKEVDKDWQKTWEIELPKSLIIEMREARSKSEFDAVIKDLTDNQTDMTKIINHLFKKSVELGNKQNFDEIMNDDMSITSKVQKIHESHQEKKLKTLFFNYQRFIQRIEFEDEHSKINPELSTAEKIEAMKEILKTQGPSTSRLVILTDYIDFIPPEISHFTELTSLTLSKINITIPPELGMLPKLEFLLIVNNLIETVPEELANLTSLKFLSLANNQLVTLPAEFSTLPHFPNIEGNPIAYLPSQLIPQAPEEYANYAFNLVSDLDDLQDVRSGKKAPDTLPPKLQYLLKQAREVGGFEGLSELIKSMNMLSDASLEFIGKPSIDTLIDTLMDLLNFGSDTYLIDQQVSEEVINAMGTLSEEEPIFDLINEVVATAFDLDLEANPKAGIEKFLLQPMHPKILEVIQR